MKQLVLFSLLLCLGLNLGAQDVVRAAAPQPRQATKNLELTGAVTIAPPASRAVADTIFPAILADECANSPTLFLSDTSGTMGYVTGSNQFADFEKLQRVTLEEAVDVTVSEVVVAFAVVEDSIANRPIVVNIYTDLNADGSFGTLAGASDTLLVADLQTSDSSLVFTRFPFSNPAVLEGVSSFLISVDVSGVYFDPATGDFDPKGNVGIFSTDAGCGDGNNLYEIFPVDGGLAFNSVFNNWGMLNIEMFVGAIIDRDPFTSTRTPNADFGATALPNPADDRLTITFTAPAAGDYRARILSSNGRVVSEQSVRAIGGENRTEFSVADLPAGVYLYQVEGANGIQTARFVKR